jgi:hypothetical protein
VIECIPNHVHGDSLSKGSPDSKVLRQPVPKFVHDGTVTSDVKSAIEFALFAYHITHDGVSQWLT